MKNFSRIKIFQEFTKMTNFHVQLWFLDMTTQQQFLKSVLKESQFVLEILEKFEVENPSVVKSCTPMRASLNVTVQGVAILYVASFDTKFFIWCNF